MIRNIIFDLGGVLLNLDMPLCFRNFAALGADREYFLGNGNAKGATICEGITASGDMDLYQVGGIGTEDFLEAIRRVCRPGTTTEDVLGAWNSCLLDVPAARLELLKWLRGEGYGVYMLSNTNDAHWRRIAEVNFPEPLDVYFDGVFLSHELGMAKPDEGIYREVLRCIGTPADECLFIDDAGVNCDAARGVGIRAVRYEIGSDLRRVVEEGLGKCVVKPV